MSSVPLAHAEHLQVIEALRFVDSPKEHSFEDLITFGLAQANTELEVRLWQITGQHFLIHTVVLECVGSFLNGALLEQLAVLTYILIEHACQRICVAVLQHLAKVH